MKANQATEFQKEEWSFRPLPNCLAKRVTQKQIALAAKVHNCTVSLALRDHPSLPLKTRKRIQSLAKRLGYSAENTNQILTAYRCDSLSWQHVSEIALFLARHPDGAEDPARASDEIVEGIKSAAEGLGYKIRSVLMAPGETADVRFANDSAFSKVSGIILLGDEPTARLLASATSVPLVRVSDGHDAAPPAGVETVVVDVAADLILACRRLREQGFRRLGLVTTSPTDSMLFHAVDALTAGMPRDEEPWFFERFQLSKGAVNFPCLGSLETNSVPNFDRWLACFQPDILIADSSIGLDLLSTLEPVRTGRMKQCSLQVPGRAPAIPGIKDSLRLAGATAVLHIESRSFSDGPGDLPPSTIYIGGIWSEGLVAP